MILSVLALRRPPKKLLAGLLLLVAAVIYILSSPVFAIFLSKSIDYKFTRENDENILKNRYKMQLLLYKQAIEKAENIKIDKVYLISLLNKKIIIF